MLNHKDYYHFKYYNSLMPLCEICYTYFAIQPCPYCNKPTSRRINALKQKNKIEKKGIWLTSTADELDFIWAQICQKTIQRVRTNSVMLRQGTFSVSNDEISYNFEFIGSTFNQSFHSRIERLYPGIETIYVVCDIVSQNFTFNSLKEMLNDIFLVNRNRIGKIYLIWLEPYINVQNQYDQYKEDVREVIKSYLIERNRQIEFIESNFPMYSSQRFSDKLKEIFIDLSSNNGIEDILKLPLRPLFRTDQPLLDPNASNRVIILDMESSPLEKVSNNNVNPNLIDSIESFKCIACSLLLKSINYRCLTCKSQFCDNCANITKSEGNFCLGSIYHGLHRFSLLK